MNSSNSKIVEEVREYLGLDALDKGVQRYDLGSQHMREWIDETYALAGAKLPHHDAVVTAFRKTHHNMYIDDPAFCTTFKKEMTARGIPKPEIEDACELVDDVLDKMVREFDTHQEKDGGHNENWDEIEEVSQPEQPENGGIIDRKDLNDYQDGNIDSDIPYDRNQPNKRQDPTLDH